MERDDQVSLGLSNIPVPLGPKNTPVRQGNYITVLWLDLSMDRITQPRDSSFDEGINSKPSL